MKKIHLTITGIAILGILVLMTVTKGIGGVAAAEDERFKINGTTLTRYLGTDTFATVPDTVTAIGEEAFAGNETLAGLEIPDSVETISYNAFKNCTALTGIILPDSVRKVGPGAFEGCTALASVEIGKGVSSWGTGVFTNCDSLATVTIDRDNEYLTYYNGALYNGNMTMLYQVLPGRQGDNYVMPDTVKEIDAYAFWNLKNTKNVKVSSKVASIPKYAMTNMGSVENAVLQDASSGIGEKAFADCVNLKQVVLPASVVNIDKKAFSGCTDLTIYTSKSSAADTFGKENSIEVIYKDAPYPTDFMDSNEGLEEKPDVGDRPAGNTATTETNTTATTTAQRPSQSQETDKETGSEPSSGGSQSTKDYIHPLDVPEDGSVIGKTVIVAGRAVLLMNNHDERVYGIPDGVQADVLTEQEARQQESGTPPAVNSIPQREFYQQKGLTNYEISETINNIGRMAFAESGLEKIDIPASVTKIEYGAFMGCTALTDVTIPDTVSDIGTKAFEKTAWLDNWRNGAGGDSDFLIVGDGILLAYRGSEAHVEIPEGVKQIGSEVFKGHTEILDADIPDSVTKICAEAFRNCSSLTGLTGCGGLKTVIRGAFYGTRLSETTF